MPASRTEEIVSSRSLKDRVVITYRNFKSIPMRLRAAIVHWDKILLMCRDCDCMQSIRCHQNWNQEEKMKER